MAEVAVELQPLPASGLPTSVPAPPPNLKNLSRFHHSAITRCMCRQCKRAFEYVRACIGISWAKLPSIWMLLGENIPYPLGLQLVFPL